MKKILSSASLIILPMIVFAQASVPTQSARYFNGPTVSRVTSSTADVALSGDVLAGLTTEDRAQVYFEYTEPNRVCILIYPQPEACRPKTTPKGQTSVTLTGLTQGTAYSVTYKRDNTIRCITAPCPSNELRGLSVDFTTTVSDPRQGASVPITHTLYWGSYGAEVVTLQTILKQAGFYTYQVTGYYGKGTVHSVKKFQKSVVIPPTGVVGSRTRAALLKLVATGAQDEVFEGVVQAVSTACFADGECSITISGKKVVTTVGWSQQVVGSVRGVADFGQVQNKIGSRAKVFAQKTADGYTLYGNAAYYVEIF
jgi:Putative peptidoglycan binding domain